MKTKLLLIVAFLVSSLSIAQCDYTLELTDNFGNEWDSGDNLAANAGVDVSINGVVTTYLVLNSSPNTPATTVVENYTITVNDGDAIEIDYRATFFPGDAGFRLLDSEGIEVYASPINQASAMDLFVGTATCPTCFAVTTLTTNNITATGADIGWTATGTESAWEVEYGPVGFTPGTGITDNATSNPWTIDGLMSETAYDVYVRADCGMGDISSNQGPINFTTTESCPAPTNFASQDETASEIQFIWDDNGNSSTNYEVNYGVAPFNQGDAGGQTVQGFFGTFAQITGLTSNTEYSFYVRYDCGMSDFSSWSGPYTASTLQSCPDIENIVFSNIDQTSVDIAWDNGGTETEWEIEYGPAPLTAGTGTTVIANTNPFTLTGLMSGTSYDICVTAVCAPTDRSTPVCAEVLTPADYCNGDQLVDSGGPTGNYSANELVTYTVCPDNTGDVVYVEFLEFILEDSFAGCWDDLTIYDGPDTNSPIILTPGGDEGWCWDVTSGTGDLTGETLIGKLPSGCLTFVFDSDGSGQRAGFIADVTCAAPPACPTPFDVVVDGSTPTTVDLSWEAGGTETEWDIEYGATGFLPGDGTVVNAMTNPFSVPGLTQNTTYDFYITAVCGSGDESSVVGPISGITQCDAETTPYSEDFEVGFTPTTSGFPGAADAFVSENCYSTDNSNYAWVLAPGTLTASGGTGPAPSVTTGNYFYAEGSNGTENDIADLITPLFDSSSLTIPSVGFDYHMAGVDIGSLEVIVRASGVDTVVGTITGTQQVLDTDPYVNLNIALNAFAGETFQIIFRATRGADFASDIAIDNVTIAEAPTCPSPLGLTLDASTATTLDLSWTNGGTETAWEIEYVDAGEAQGTGTIVAAATNPFTVTGLTSSTTYDLYLRAVCAAGDESVWIGPLSVTTDAACGDVVFDTGGATGDFSNNENYSITYLPENAGDVVTLTFTALDLPTTDILSVYDGLDTAAPVLDADVRATGLYRATNPDGALTIQFISNGFTTGDGWEANYTCAAPPTCFEVTDIDVTNVTTTTADIAWTSNGTEMLWDVEFVEQGSTPTGTPTESATTNPYTTSSLSSGTFYEVYVRANCGNGDVSLYTGPFSFSTVPDYCAGDLFLDSGGASGQYQNNETITYNICPDNAGDVVYVDFISNQMEDSFAGCWDGLTIYDGPDNTSPIITTPNGATEWCWDDGSGTGDLTLEILIGTSTSGCLTFEWSSDGSGQRDGWEANVTCAAPPSCDVPTDLTFSAVNSSSFDFTWTDNASASEFIVEYRETGAMAFTTITPNPTTNSVTISSLPSNTEYEVCVTAVCDLAANDLSMQVCGTISTTPDYCAGDLFLDSGGASGQYQSNETITYNICPDNAGDVVYVDFISNQMEDNSFSGSCYDGLTIYDGPDATFPIITTPNGDNEWCWDDGSGTGDLTLETLIGTSTSGCLTFVWSSDGSSQRDGWEANVTCAAPPSCDVPTDLSFSAVNSSSFDFTWTDNASASEFIVEYRETGAMAFTTITPNPTTNSVTISSLLSSTEYEVCVTAVCDLAANDLSMQVCGTISTTPDYCGGDLFLDSGGASGQYQNNETITYNICPDNAGDVVYVDFISNQMEDNSFSGSCYDGLTIYDGPDATFPIITTPNGDNEWCWDDGSGTGDLTLETLIGTSTSGCLTFVWSSDGSGQRDGWEANVTCAPPPACPDVNTLTATQITSSSAVLAWTEVGTASVWQVEVQPTTVAQGTAGAIFEDMAATNPITATGLSSNTTYDYFVRSDCGAGDFSEWIGPFTFTTACDVVTQYPYITDFDLNVPNACWDEAEDGEIADGPMGLGDSEWRARNYTDAAGNLLESNAINLYRAEDREWLISESYDMTGTDNDVLTVEVAVTNWNSNTVGDTMGSDDQVDLLVTTDGGTTWTSLMAWTVANQPAVTGERMTFDLSSYTGTVQFAFLASDGTTDNTEDYDFHVGVFIIDGTASNEDLSSFDFTFYPNPTSDMVNFNGQQVIDAISVKNLLGQQLLITKPNATSSNVDLSTFPSGMYLIEVTSGEQSKVVKVMRK